MVLSPEKIREAIFSAIPPERVAAIYQVGIIDDSPLSDTDVVVIVRGDTAGLRELLAQKLTKDLDVRAVLAVRDFFWPSFAAVYPRAKFIFGDREQVSETPLQRTRELLLFGSLFFTSFLRNYYDLAARSSIDVKSALRHLNDFAYFRLFFPEESAEICGSLIERIFQARRNPEIISQSYIREVLAEAIECSWVIIGVIEKKMREAFPEKSYGWGVFSDREPTVFFPTADSAACRRLTERLGLFIPARLKIMVLPSFFGVVSGDEILQSSVLRLPSDGVVQKSKNVAKKFFLLVAYVYTRLCSIR